MKKVIALLMATAVSACASNSKEIQAAYVSPMQYESFNCNQIQLELQRVSSRVSQLGGAVDKKASNDSVAMGVGMVLFWPALFFLKGDGPEAQEYARLKGEHEALLQAGVKKECTFASSQPPADPKAAKPAT